MSYDATSTVAMLAKVDLFSGLSGRQLRKLEKLTRSVDHSSGQTVATEGHGPLAFHLIAGGTASVSVQGSEVRSLGAGDYFGEISAIDGKPRSATITATSALKTLAIPHHEFDRLLSDEPEFAHTILLVLCSRLRDAESR